MDSDLFLTTIEDGCIVLKTASDVVRFSFIVQRSISYLDLKVCDNSRISRYFRSPCDSCVWRRVRYFVNTEERCRNFFAPKRRLLYTLNLNLPRGRECSLRSYFPKFPYRCCSRTPHIAAIRYTRGFHDTNLSNFIEEAFSINTPKEKILKWILKIPPFFFSLPLLSRLEIGTTSKFISCFYPEVADSALFNDFIWQFDLLEWMKKHEQPKILEFLLYHARLNGNISLDEGSVVDLIGFCISFQHYRNIGPILKYASDSEPTHYNYENYLFDISLERTRLTEEVIEKIAKLKTEKRICRMAQIIWICIDTHPSHEAASEALRLIWSSIPDACVTFGELKDTFKAAFSEEELMLIHGFYVKAIGEFHAYVEPRSLQHLCRTVLRRTFQKNDLWIPAAIRQTGLPKSLKAFLNLEKPFAV